MNQQAILEELLALLEANNVAVRSECMGGGGGGLCMIKDKPIFFMDSQASVAETIAICADAVSKTVDIETVYIKPQVRQFIEDYIKRKK
jgi:hypothetical protein